MKKKAPLVCLLLVLVAGAALSVWGMVLPNNALQKATALLEAGSYDEAAAVCSQELDRPLSFRSQDVQSLLGRVYYQKAEALMDKGEYQAADNAFRSAGDYSNAADRIGEPFYVKAEALLERGDYKGASAAFQSAGDYSDAAARILEPYFRQGEALMAESRFMEAAAAFEKASGWSCADQAMQYCLGCAALEAGDPISAAEAFQQAGDYVDAAALYAQTLPKAQAMEHLEETILPYRVPGTVVTFGVYEQDGAADNGPEPLRWIVLQATETACMLITESAIDCQTVARDLLITGWQESHLRGWLNGSFKSAAFGSPQLEALCPAPTTNDHASRFAQYNPYSNDLVTMIDTSEFAAHFHDLSTGCTLTPAAVLAGAIPGKDGLARWWLCDKSTESDEAPIVSGDDSFYRYVHVNEPGIAVRPVVWVQLEKLAALSPLS